jgi:predicted TIM-barrel fold metal-dependent hydrolase
MVQTQVRSIDGDGHVIENVSQLLEHLEAPYRSWYGTGRAGAVTLLPGDGAPRGLGGKFSDGPGNTTESWLKMMQEGDLESAILYPTGGLFAGFLKDPDYTVAFSRAYNNWLAKDLLQPAQGLLGVALLPVRDPEEAAQELRRAKQDLELVGAMLAADGGHLLGQRQYDPLYKAAAEVDMPLAIHASGSWAADAHTTAHQFPKFIQAHTISHPFGILRQFTSMMFEGVFERFPTVRFAFLECGGSWVPWWLDRMDEEYEHRGTEEAPDLKHKPSTFVHEGGNLFFGCEAEERLLGPTLDVIGNTTVMYASDWPHWDGDYPSSLFEIQQREDLTEEQRHGLLFRAAEQFYGLK